MRSNAEIARALGYDTTVAEAQQRVSYDGEWIEILDPRGDIAHIACYRRTATYEQIINHCISIGRIPDWNRVAQETKIILSALPKDIRKEFLDELA